MTHSARAALGSQFYDAALAEEATLAASPDEPHHGSNKALAPRARRPSDAAEAPHAAEGAPLLAKDGWLDLRRRDREAISVPVFMHCAGYLLSWYRDKPIHGELAKPLRTVDLRELHLVSSLRASASA